jgi:hypothetical protein
MDFTENTLLALRNLYRQHIMSVPIPASVFASLATNPSVTSVAPITKKSNVNTRTRNNAGKNEEEDIKKIIIAINTQSSAGINIINQFNLQYGKEIIEAKARPTSNRSTHFDFFIKIRCEPDKWYRVEHKGGRICKPIPIEYRPWTTGVQFHNGGCDTYNMSIYYAKIWYDILIGSGRLKKDWNISAPIPTFDDWFNKDAKTQGDPKTDFGKELKSNVYQNRKESLREYRAEINELFNPSFEDFETFKTQILSNLNESLEQKDYWLTIQGDLDEEFHCKWYPKFTLSKINTITMRKEKDIWFDIICDDGIKFSCILRWGKGAGFSNIRIDSR